MFEHYWNQLTDYLDNQGLEFCLSVSLDSCQYCSIYSQNKLVARITNTDSFWTLVSEQGFKTSANFTELFNERK